MLPVPAERIDAVSADGDVADLGDGRSLMAVHTPGHAAHHMALWLPSGREVFAGDAVGVYLAEAGRVHPATPPPEFDLEAALDSIDRIGRLGPGRVFPTHFGPMPAVGPLLEEAGATLRRAVDLGLAVAAAGGGVGDLVDAFRDEQVALTPDLDPIVADRLAHTTTDELNARGVARYLTKRRGVAFAG